MRHHTTSDPLTYTYPRTWAEAISRMPTQGQDARAVERYRAPLRLRLVDWICRYGAAACLVVGLIIFLK